MLGKIENLDSVDKMEIENLLRDIEKGLSIIENLSFEGCKQRRIFDAQESFKILKNFLLG
jgi:hypothetical protein